MRPGFALLAITGFFLLSACTTLTGKITDKEPYIAGRASELVLKDLQSRNQGLFAAKGVGRIKFIVQGRARSARCAWIVAQPDRIRLEAYAVAGQALLRIISDGKSIHLWSYLNPETTRGVSASTGLHAYLGIPLKVGRLDGEAHFNAKRFMGALILLPFILIYFIKRLSGRK